ncbi:MFS transporter [Hazenella coriacea]|uniref:Putative MFS family arabinose efflux permease n=1 Tax=Hazenella coriacea TaxID=1179467 RepID=A0A4R3L5F5_9BACL|nr:MFS transporter [Hazenella coriacea]TCS94869.1 putative MFS family arabinose efflux permease [Hazenella coriacea]
MKSRKSGLWRNRIYRRMFAAYSVSVMGGYFDFIAMSVLVAYDWKTAPFLIGLVPVVQALPGILFGSWAGVLADRWPKRNLLIIADLSIAIFTGLIIFINSIYLLLPLLFLRNIFNELFMPAQQALTKEVVEEEYLDQAVTWNGMVGQLGKIVGPLAGGALLLYFSTTSLLIIKIVANLVSAWIFFRLGKVGREVRERNQTLSEKKGMWSLWLEGIQVVTKKRVLFVAVLSAFVTLSVLNIVEAQIGTLFRELFPQSPSLMGWAIAVTGIGGGVGVFIVSQLKNNRYEWLIGGGMVLIGLGFGGIGLFTQDTSFLIVVPLIILAGIGAGLFLISYNIILQKESDKENTGRVFGLSNTVISVTMIIPPIIGGGLVEWLGVSQVYFGVGCVLVALGCFTLVFQKMLWGTRQQVVLEEVKENVQM